MAGEPPPAAPVLFKGWNYLNQMFSVYLKSQIDLAGATARAATAQLSRGGHRRRKG